MTELNHTMRLNDDIHGTFDLEEAASLLPL